MPRASRIALATLVLLAATGALGVSTTVADSGSRIVFAADARPTLDGEIFRVGPGGKSVDLSRSPALDEAPSVSPDGREVAFLSVRTGRVAVYTVGTDGTGLRRVSPYLGTFVAGNLLFGANIAWAPAGDRLAVGLVVGRAAGVYVVSRTGAGWRRVSENGNLDLAPPAWSRDGRYLAYTPSARTVRVVALAGGRSWTAPGSAPAWSAAGRLAVQGTANRIAVYDETGRELTSVAGTWAAWSPDGSQLATLTHAGTIAIRAGGSGRPTFETGGFAFQTALKKPTDDMLRWVSAGRVAISGSDGWAGLDIRSGRLVQLPSLERQLGSTVSPDLRAVVADTGTASIDRLELQNVATGTVSILTTHARCGLLEYFGELQVARGDRTVVYEATCPDPPAALWSLNPSGGQPSRLPQVPLGVSDPTLSPDGSEIAYVQRAASTCFTCHDAIWIASADGTGARQLTAPGDGFDAPDDESPSFSPDGSEIVFARTTGGTGLFHDPTASHLFVVPVAGGPPRALGIVGSQPAWGPTEIAYVNGSQELAVVRPDGSGARAATQPSLIGAFGWSPVGGALALLAPERTGAAIALSSGKTIPLPGLQLGLDTPVGIAFSPDGGEIAFVADDAEGVGDVFEVSAAGGPVTRLTHDLGATGAITWR